jgi:DNA-binding IscR family transcriptional regulator
VWQELNWHGNLTITLLKVYKAVEAVPEDELVSVHAIPNPKCIVGCHIQAAMEKVFSHVTIADVVKSIEEQENK